MAQLLRDYQKHGDVWARADECAVEYVIIQSIAGHNLRDDGAASMATLQQNTSLTYLCLKYNRFTPRVVACLF